MGRVTDVDYNILIVQLLPVRLRKPRMIAWVKVLCTPIKNHLYEKFKAWEEKSWFDIKYQSGSVAHLEYVLNVLLGYDPEERLIRIGPGSRPLRLFIALRAQNDPLYLGKVFVYRRNNYLFGDYDFSILVSDEIEGFNEELCRAIAARYKRDSKNYVIKYETF